MTDPHIDQPGILYSFRRCPYAIRARLALSATAIKIDTINSERIHSNLINSEVINSEVINSEVIETNPITNEMIQTNSLKNDTVKIDTIKIVTDKHDKLKNNTIRIELREVNLACKPPELLAVSAKGTVPVLVLADGTVLDDSQAIVRWCLERSGGSWPSDGPASEWIRSCDGEFKELLDQCRYPQRYPHSDANIARQRALSLLRLWNQELIDHPELGERPELTWLIGPFLRQFRNIDAERFALEPGLEPLRGWLEAWLSSPALQAVMDPPWAERRLWYSPSWLYHLCLGEEWRQAKQEGFYPWSTRGMTLASVGFVHASWQHQVAATYRRFYADAKDVVLLILNPVVISAAGVAIRPEPAPDSGELFPHLYGPLPMESVLRADPYPGEGSQQG